MSNDSAREGLRNVRPVLGDVTNRPRKRTFSSISGDSGSKSGDAPVKKLNDNKGGSIFAKEVCLGVENFVKQKCRSVCVENTNEKVPPSFKISENDSGSDKIALTAIDIPDDNDDSPNVLGATSGVAKPDSAGHSVLEVGDTSRDSSSSSVSIISMPAYSVPCEGDSNVLSTGNLTTSKYGPTEFSRMANSSGSGSFEMGRCTMSMGDGSSNSSANFDMIKSCSCSFCLKAAYILSDLHYQDINGRLTAIKKSQKEASNLIQKSCKLKESSAHGHGSSKKPSKLEHDLMSQWKSLFLHMEGIFASENKQLQQSFISLKELRDDCKTNLELMKGRPSDKG